MRRSLHACIGTFALALCAGCEPSATVGQYTDAGARCDPLSESCGPTQSCVLSPDPSFDACRPTGGLAVGEACDTADACTAGSACAAIGSDDASIAPEELDPGVCARVCARDAVGCESGERCVSIRATGGVRIDYGVCVRGSPR